MGQRVLSHCWARHCTSKGHGASGDLLLPALPAQGEGLTWDPRGTRHAWVAAASFSPLTLLASLPCRGRKREGRTHWSCGGKHRPSRGGGCPCSGTEVGTSAAGGGRVSPRSIFAHWVWIQPPTFGSDVADLPGSAQDAGDSSRSHGSMRALLTRRPWGTRRSRGSHGTHSPQGGSLGTDRHLCQLLCRAERGWCGTGPGGSQPVGSAPLVPSPCSIFRTTSTMCWSPASRPCQRREGGHSIKGDRSFHCQLHPQSQSHPSNLAQTPSSQPVPPSHPFPFLFGLSTSAPALAHAVPGSCNLLTAITSRFVSIK